MQTKIIRIFPDDSPARIDELLLPAARALAAGQLVAFPTETVYGLGGNALDAAAIQAIFAVKGRPADNPLIVHVARPADLRRLTSSCPPVAEALLAAFSPGPLTLILPKAAIVPDGVTAGLATVAVRIPAHPIARRLIELAGVPVAAPSANRSGRPSPTRGWHVIDDLDGAIPFIIDAGDCEYGLESTVLDLTGPVPEILRPGAITADQIRAVAGDVGGIGTSQPLRMASPEKPRSPGMKYRHYAPRAELRIVDAPEPADRARLLVSQLASQLAACNGRIGLYACTQTFDCLAAILGQTSLTGQPGSPGQTSSSGHFRMIQPGQTAAALQAEKLDQPANTIFQMSYAAGPDPVAAARHLFDALRSFDALGVALIIAEALPAAQAGAAYMNRLNKAAGGGAMVAGLQKG
jgi:L-threonylcarbamoyladenylate synthase